MKIARALAVLAPMVVACGGGAAESAPPAAPEAVRQTAAAPVPAAATASVTATAVPAKPVPPVPATFEAEDRQILEELVSVDTSHGNETKALEPIAERYKRAGVPVQILESAPGRGNLIARLKGEGKKKPLLLIAHIDVVPVEGQPWTVPTFTPTEKDGFLSGRGVNDDKAMAAAIVAVTLEMARTKAKLSRDVIVALTAGEETGGMAGARWLAEKHKDLLDAEVALNEGGSIRVDDEMTKVERVSIAVSEKQFQSYRLIARGNGGHSSMPPVDGDPATVLARALVKIGEHRFPARVLPEVKNGFAIEVTHAKPENVEAIKHMLASAPKVAPADDKVLSKERTYNAQIRTTCVTTMLQGSPQDNVLPTTAEATVNCRVLPGETLADTQAALARIIGNPAIEIVPAPAFGDAPASPEGGEVFDAVKKVSAAMLGAPPVVASMTAGATDSRYLRAIGIRAYGISPVAGSQREALASHMAHGPDERASVKWIGEGAKFFRELVRTLTT